MELNDGQAPQETQNSQHMESFLSPKASVSAAITIYARAAPVTTVNLGLVSRLRRGSSWSGTAF